MLTPRHPGDFELAVRQLQHLFLMKRDYVPLQQGYCEDEQSNVNRQQNTTKTHAQKKKNPTTQQEANIS